MEQQPAYSVHEADVERDRELILGLWRGNLGEDGRMARKYDWFYRQCPYGAPLTMLLRHEASGTWVGVASAGPRPFLLDGRRVLAGVLVDLAVLPAHRSLGPALILQKAVMDAGLRRFGFLYGFPNPKAAPVFKRVGYAPLGRLDRHARVLGYGSYLRRRLPAALAAPMGWMLGLGDRLRLSLAGGGLSGEWRDAAGPELQALWSPEAAGPGPVAVRDAAFLQWRFDASPWGGIRYLVVRGRAGGVRAWFACEAREHGLHVHDAWSARGAAGPSKAELAALLRAARSAGHRSVSVELSAAAAAGGAWQAAGFSVRESRPVFGSASRLDPDLLARNAWLTSADEDE